MLTPNTPRMIDDALHVARHPELYHDKPSQRVLAWRALKAQRGQRVNFLRLDQMLRALRPVSTATPLFGSQV